VARLISSKDAELARKYRLGIPNKKVSFVPSCQATVPIWLSESKASLALVCGLCFASLGLYLDIHTTLLHQNWTIWLWTFLASCFPLTIWYSAQTRGKRSLVLFNACAVVISLCIITLYKVFFSSFNEIIDPSLSLLDGLCLQGLGYLLCWRYYKFITQPRSILLCTEGCFVAYPWNRVHILHWQNVTDLWTTPLKTRVVCKNGSQFSIAHSLPNAHIVREMIFAKVSRYIRLTIMDRYESGALVHFGPYALSQQGVFDGIQTFPWHVIHECEYTHDKVALIGHDASYLTYFPIVNLPNAAVFVAIVNTIAQSHTT
jgi:hypothetical protein